MANTLTAFNPEFWAAQMQETYLKENVAVGFARTEFKSDLAMGDTLHRPYGSYARVQTYTKGTDITVKDLSSTDETLTVDTAKVASFYIDDIDKVQNKWDVATEYATMAGRQLSNNIEQAVLSNYSSAGTTMTGTSIGEASGAIVMTAANTANIFTGAGRVLNGKKRMSRDRVALIGPRALETIQTYVGGRETGFGDTVSDNGVVANRFGFQLVLTNNLPYTATLTISAAVTDGDTVTINGVVFTFKTTLTGSATLGEVLIGANAAASNANLTKAIDDSGTVDTHYSALSAENRQLIEEAGLDATATSTTTAIAGYGDIVVSETLTDAANVWSAQKSFMLMMVRGSIDLVTQVAPNVEFRDAQLRLGRYVHPWTLYGHKLFTRNVDNLVVAQIDASSWT